MADTFAVMAAASEIEMFFSHQIEVVGPDVAAVLLSQAIGYSVGNASPTLDHARAYADVLSKTLRDTAVDVFLDRGRAGRAIARMRLRKALKWKAPIRPSTMSPASGRTATPQLASKNQVIGTRCDLMQSCGTTSMAKARGRRTLGWSRFHLKCGREISMADSLRKYGPAPYAPREGDKQQARQRINVEVRTGHRPHPNVLPCYDCGHIWSHGERRHEYDHHLGYAAEHHYDVQPVCTRCHAERDSAKKAQTHCIRGHALDVSNTYLARNGTRHCCECSREHDRQRNPRGSDYWREVNRRRRERKQQIGAIA